MITTVWLKQFFRLTSDEFGTMSDHVVVEMVTMCSETFRLSSAFSSTSVPIITVQRCSYGTVANAKRPSFQHNFNKIRLITHPTALFCSNEDVSVLWDDPDSHRRFKRPGKSPIITVQGVVMGLWLMPTVRLYNTILIRFDWSLTRLPCSVPMKMCPCSEMIPTPIDALKDLVSPQS